MHPGQSGEASQQFVEVNDADDKLEQSPERLVSNIIKVHKLKKIAQWSVKSLGVEAIVAEFNSDRQIEDVLSALQGDMRVESVQRVNTYDLLAYNDPYFHLQNTVANEDLERVHELATGKNVVVGVVDTGVDRSHPELKDRIVFAENFVSYDQQDFDNDEHGTSVAGVISSAANNDLGIVGVAPDARLMIFKACSQNDLTRKAYCDSFSLMKGLIEVLRQKPDIVNLSLAGPEDPLLARLINRTIESGIVVIAAVDSSNSQNTFPASVPGVLAVNSAFQFDKSRMPESSVVAPGMEMLTTTPGATYAFRSGSSMSTAFVSGIAALMKEQDPGISSSQMVDVLYKTAKDRIEQFPLVDICHVIKSNLNEEVCLSKSVVSRSEPVR